jgi:hypothetical protein
MIALIEPMRNTSDELESPPRKSDGLLGLDVYLLPHGSHGEIGRGRIEFVQKLDGFPTKKPAGETFDLWLAAIRVEWWSDKTKDAWKPEAAKLVKHYADKLAADPLVYIPAAVSGVFEDMRPQE